ncbi:MAG: N-acetyltransferase [Deltaproteobacteria bacterium]|nr:N-acetyltransferase [Deltaproteobacteria bacterium]
MNITTRIYTHVEDISSSLWDSLAEHAPVFYNHAWFKTFEDQTSNEPVYITAYHNNKLVGILPGFVVKDPCAYIFHNPRDVIFSSRFLSQAAEVKDCHHVVKLIKKYHGWIVPLLNKFFFPSLVFVSPYAYINDILVAASVESKNEVVDKLFEEAYRFVSNNNIKTMLFAWVSHTNKYLVEKLMSEKFVTAYGQPFFILKTNFNSFDEYLSSIGHKRCNMVRGEIRKFLRNDIVIKKCKDVFEFSEYKYRFAELLTQHMQRHGNNAECNKQLKILEQLFLGFNGGADVYYAKKGDEIVSFLMSFNKGGIAYPKYYANEYTMKGINQNYFQMIFYNLIGEKIKEKHKAIYYGFSSEEPKLIRGCQSYNACNYFNLMKPRLNKLLGKFLVQYNWARKKYYELKYGQLVLEEKDSFLLDD